MDEMYVKVEGVWNYLYGAVNFEGNTLGFRLSVKQDGKAAARFFRKVLKGQHIQASQVITIDKNAADYVTTVDGLEQIVGYGFFTNVSTEIQNVIEAKDDRDNCDFL